MSNRYRLVGLRDEQVLRGVSGLVAQVNALTADVLAHLVEVDSRMLYAELGFPNLFSYCVTSLRLSEGAALRGGSRVSALSRGVRIGGERRVALVRAVRVEQASRA